MKHELTVVSTESGTVLLRDNRIVIPKSLQKQVVDIAHEGHQGVIKTKALMREKVWFPELDSVVNDVCRQCIPC